MDFLRTILIAESVSLWVLLAVGETYTLIKSVRWCGSKKMNGKFQQQLANKVQIIRD